MNDTVIFSTTYPREEEKIYFSSMYANSLWLEPAPVTEVSHAPITRYYMALALSGHRFYNWELISKTGIGFELSEDSVVVELLSAGISESGETEQEALSNLMFMVSYTLDDYQSNPNQLLSKRLKRQKEILEGLFRHVQTDNEGNGSENS